MEEDRKEDIFQSPPEYHSRMSRPKQSQNPIKKILIIFLFIVILGVILFGAFRLITGGETNELSQEPSPTIESFPTDIPDDTQSDEDDTEEADEATPTPKVEEDAELDRADLSIHVLNGSGVSGASSKASDFLEDLDYNVIQIGNATNFDYQETEIRIKKSKSQYLNQLESDLSGNYTVGSTSTNLSENERPDAIVIIGAE